MNGFINAADVQERDIGVSHIVLFMEVSLKKLEIGEKKMAVFEVYQDKRLEWRWRMVASNGRIIADSGEGYVSKPNVLRAVKQVIKSTPKAEIKTIEN